MFCLFNGILQNAARKFILQIRISVVASESQIMGMTRDIVMMKVFVLTFFFHFTEKYHCSGNSATRTLFFVFSLILDPATRPQNYQAEITRKKRYLK
jgi:hypothetical protein